MLSFHSKGWWWLIFILNERKNLKIPQFIILLLLRTIWPSTGLPVWVRMLKYMIMFLIDYYRDSGMEMWQYIQKLIELLNLNHSLSILIYILFRTQDWDRGDVIFKTNTLQPSTEHLRNRYVVKTLQCIFCIYNLHWLHLRYLKTLVF